MASPASPAETRALIVERLVGDTGEPDHVVEAARAMGERALSSLMETLNASLASPVTIELGNVELARFSQAKPLSGNHAMTIASSSSSPDALVLLLDSDALTVVVNALFGGDPDLPLTPIARDFSPTEIEVASMVFQAAAASLNGSGPRALDIKFPLPAAMTGAELRKHVVRDGPAVRLAFEIFTGKSSGRLSLLMPQRVLLKHRGGAIVGEAAAPATDWGARFSEEVMRSTVTLEATMPLLKMTLGDIAGLEAGQVIELEPGAQSRARLAARNKTLFVCEFGKLGQNYTVRIRHPYDEGQDFIDGLLPH